MKNIENASIKFLFISYIIIFLKGIRIRQDARYLITNEQRFSFERRKSFIILDLFFVMYRLAGTFLTLFQSKLEYAYNVHFLNLYFVVTSISKIILHGPLGVNMFIELILHLLYTFLFYKIYYYAKEIFLVKSLRSIGCGVRKMRMVMVRKKTIVQRYLIYVIILLRQITLILYEKRMYNHYFIVFPLINMIMTKFEHYEIRTTKIITILLWFMQALTVTYRIIYDSEVDDLLHGIRLILFVITLYLHFIYNLLDLFFYGYGINKLF